jgi:hypothetical protein
LHSQYHIMLKKKYLLFLIGSVTLVLTVKLLTVIIAEPWLLKKIERGLNEKNKNYLVEIEKVKISLLSSGIEINNISISTKLKQKDKLDLSGRIDLIKFKGIRIAKALLRKDIDIREVVISGSRIKGRAPFSQKKRQPVIVPFNLKTRRLIINKTDMSVESTSTAQVYSVKEGVLKVYNLKIAGNDTLSPAILSQFDFEAKEMVSVSADSMYSFLISNALYTSGTKELTVKSFTVQPNHKDYDFTSHYEFQKNRIDAGLSNIFLKGFDASGYISSGNIICKYAEIGKFDVKIFRDKRKEFRHENRAAFQDMIYNYPGIMHIDSIGIISGNIVYTEHSSGANEPGSLSLTHIKATINNIANDTVYKTKPAFLKFRTEAMLMGKGRMSVYIKTKLFNPGNTFSVDGTLGNMEVSELNPFLEKTAFIYVTSGKIESMKFSFIADNTRSDGKMTLIYQGLDLTLKNKQTDDTTAFRERFISGIINRKVLNSNPSKREELRIGIIDYQRDPEKFVVSYCARSILSGIKSTLLKGSKK